MAKIITFPRYEAPILAWSMGKVGSSGVRLALKRAGLNVEHFHYLDPENFNTIRDSLKAVGRDYDDNYLCLTEQLQAALPYWVRGGNLKIISGVRDPISRTISAYFQNFELYNGEPADVAKAHLKALSDPNRYAATLNWFENELKKVTSFDVYKHPFNRSKLFKIYKHGKVQILVYRIDIKDDVFEKTLSNFVGTDVKLIRTNVASDKNYARAYKYVKENISFDRKLINSLYNSEYCKHFWTISELHKLKNSFRMND